jgi:hypothetical protein
VVVDAGPTAVGVPPRLVQLLAQLEAQRARWLEEDARARMREARGDER